MSGSSWSVIKRVCGIFCCPPCPSNIASKLAFLPPSPTYSIFEENGQAKIRLKDEAEWQFPIRKLDCLEAITLRTSRNQTLSAMFIHCIQDAPYTILFSHGNAVDIGQMSSFLFNLGTRLQVNIFSYDYSGYGCSSGKPTEANMYTDIDAAFQCLIKRYGICPNKIILYGQSIGTVPTIELASKYEVGGVILHSPLTSGIRLACPSVRKTWCCDVFQNIEKVTEITSVVLVIHGTEDQVIDFSHGLLIYQRCPRTVDPLWVEGANHNDIEIYPQYIQRLFTFIHVDLKIS